MATKAAIVLARKKFEAAKELLEEMETEEPSEDGTKGTVGTDKEEETLDESMVIEKAGSGKGFAIYRDYSRTSQDTKLNRLIRA